VEPIVAAGDELVRIDLVAGIPDEAVLEKSKVKWRARQSSTTPRLLAK
jgi:hypothetical protein